MADKKIMQSAKGVAYKGLKVFSRKTREGIRQDAFQIPIIDSPARSLHLSMSDEVLLNFRVIDANLCDVMRERRDRHCKTLQGKPRNQAVANRLPTDATSSKATFYSPSSNGIKRWRLPWPFGSLLDLGERIALEPCSLGRFTCDGLHRVFASPEQGFCIFDFQAVQGCDLWGRGAEPH